MNDFLTHGQMIPRPVDVYDPSSGYSIEKSSIDHKHQLALPGGTFYDVDLVSNSNAANITAYGQWWSDQGLWIEVEIGAQFAGAVTAGGLFEASLPFPGTHPVGSLSEGTPIGHAVVANAGSNEYILYAVMDGTGETVYFYDKDDQFWNDGNPFTIGNGDSVSIILRYRRAL